MVIDIDRAYGTLGFRGTVERIDLGEEYEFRTHIAITFRPNERTNRTSVADLRVCELVATLRREPSLPVEVLFRQTQGIVVVLSENGETKPMPNLTFRLPKPISAQATHVGLGVSDGRILWPIPTELKGTFETGHMDAARGSMREIDNRLTAEAEVYSRILRDPRLGGPSPHAGERTFVVVASTMSPRGAWWWMHFYSLYPSAAGYLEFSRVGFDEIGSQALVYVGHYYGLLGGTGRFVLLRWDGTEWNIVSWHLVWES